VLTRSDSYNVVAPDSPNTTLVKTPRSIPYFDGMSLRDLVLEEKHGVAVDANGDVLQWGLGFFDPSSREIQQGALDDVPLARRREKARANELQPRGELAGRTLHPVKTLTGKNIVRVVANDQKIYALAKNGDVYIFSSLQTLQSPGKPAGWSLNPLKLFNLFAGPTIDHERMQTLAPLKSGETFTSLEGGSSHILALTSKGRTFAAPIDDAGNAFGQLGLSRVQLNSSPDSDGKPRRIETLLEPRMLELDGPRDPHPQRRLPAWAMPPGMESFGEPAVPVKRDAAGRKQRPKDLVEDVLRPRYCTTLHEVPALRGVEIAQIAAGSEHSVARTPSGLVLGWGRQTHGQTGLSNALGMECVPIPSEIVLSKCFPNTSVDIRCTDVKAAADNTFFTMSRREPGTVAGGKIDVLAVGKGQWGTLGNAMWSQVTSVPVKVKTVSGLIECESFTLLLREHS
jgi:alpha-tubulin suppressor-like RCC1 family protein